MALFLIVNFICLILLTNCFYYDIRLNIDIQQQDSYVIRIFKKISHLECAIECSKEDYCLACSFDRTTAKCNIYGNNLNNYEVVSTESTDFYIKKVLNLLNFFRNPIQTNVFLTYADFRNFDTSIQIDGKIFYYVASNSKVFVYNAEWSLDSVYLVNSVFYLKIVENDIYLSTDLNLLQKSDLSLKVLKSISGNYREIFYYKKNNRLYVAAYAAQRVQILDRELNLIDEILTGFNTHAVFVLNDYILVGTYNSISVYNINKTINYTIQTNCSNELIYSITMDRFGYMSICCESSGFLLYHMNGSFINIRIANSDARYMNFDEKFQAVLLTYSNVAIN